MNSICFECNAIKGATDDYKECHQCDSKIWLCSIGCYRKHLGDSTKCDECAQLPMCKVQFSKKFLQVNSQIFDYIRVKIATWNRAAHVTCLFCEINTDLYRTDVAGTLCGECISMFSLGTKHETTKQNYYENWITEFAPEPEEVWADDNPRPSEPSYIDMEWFEQISKSQI